MSHATQDILSASKEGHPTGADNGGEHRLAEVEGFYLELEIPGLDKLVGR